MHFAVMNCPALSLSAFCASKTDFEFCTESAAVCVQMYI